MSSMEDTTRNRLLALLVAVTAVFAAATVIVLFTTGSFGPVWFAASLLVYATLGTVGVGLAVLEPTSSAGAQVEPSLAQPSSEDRIQLHGTEVLYETPTGRVLRVEASTGDEERTLLFTVTQDELNLLDEVERRLDHLPAEVEASPSIEEIDAELDRQAARSLEPGIDPDTVEVELQAARTLYETGSGRLVWARYRGPSGDREQLFAVTDDQAIPIDEVERRIDQLPLASSPNDAEVQEALQAHARASPVPRPEVTHA